jgi:hypothetical protein
MIGLTGGDIQSSGAMPASKSLPGGCASAWRAPPMTEEQMEKLFLALA